MSHVAAGSSPSSLVPRSAVDVCTFVESLPLEASGELVFLGRNDDLEGAVFVENRRVCWAAARGLARRLSNLLAASSRLDAAGMEAIFHTCKLEHAPLGEYLVNAGLVSAPELRGALLQHATESLHVLCGPESAAQWFERSGGYNPQFTFATTEVLSRTFAESHRALAEMVSAELADAFDGDDWGAAFVRTEARAAPDPIAIYGSFPAEIGSLIRLGRWASSSLDVTGPLHDAHTFVATVMDEGALVAWRCGDAIIAGSTSVHGPARLMNRRARARRKDARHGSL